MLATTARRSSKAMAKDGRVLTAVEGSPEGLGAIRDVLLDGSQSTFLEIYRKADRPKRQFQAKNNFRSRFSSLCT